MPKFKKGENNPGYKKGCKSPWAKGRATKAQELDASMERIINGVGEEIERRRRLKLKSDEWMHMFYLKIIDITVFCMKKRHEGDNRIITYRQILDIARKLTDEDMLKKQRNRP